MKDKIKKIGVIGLLVAFLLPFFEMPTVKAAEEDCTHHLQQYIFLATSVSGYFGNPEYDCANGDFGNDCTFEFNNTGMYPYVFPVPLSNETIRIDSIGEMELYGNRESKSAVYDYWNTYKYILNKELDASDKYYYSGRYSSADYYNRVKNTKVDIFGGYAVLKNSSGKTYSLKYDNYTDYETVTAIMHGKFNELNEDGKIKKTDDANWGDSINPTEKTKMTLQQVFDKTNTTGLKNTFALAELSNNKYTSVSLYHGKDFRESLEYLTNNIEQAKEDGLVDVYSGDNYINLHIQREYTLTALNSLNYGDSSQNKIYSTTQGSITDSYTAYTRARDCTGDDYKSKGCTKKYTQDEDFWLVDAGGRPIDIDTKGDQLYNIPALFNVEYSVCKTGDNNNDEDKTPSENTWVLKYDKNTDDTSVTNMPDDQEQRVGQSIKINSKAPSRKDYAFKGWCLDKNGSGTCYQPGDTVTSPTSTSSLTLYASWGKTGSTDNAKTGVISYVIGFGSVGLIAGALYLIIKKKNLFKQI